MKYLLEHSLAHRAGELGQSCTSLSKSGSLLELRKQPNESCARALLTARARNVQSTDIFDPALPNLRYNRHSHPLRTAREK